MEVFDENIIKLLKKHKIDIANINLTYLLNMLDKIINENNQIILNKNEEIKALIEQINP